MQKLSKWAFQSEISFNSDPNKQVIEVRFSNKCNEESYTPFQFKSTDVQIADSQKHLVLNWILMSILKVKLPNVTK